MKTSNLIRFGKVMIRQINRWWIGLLTTTKGE